ncbi:MAG: response regulator [Phycisphaerales bacterium]|nr:response regulator [Phycisphaerales bacterium]
MRSAPVGGYPGTPWRLVGSVVGRAKTVNQAQKTIRVLLVGRAGDSAASPAVFLRDCVDLVTVPSAHDAQTELRKSPFDYVLASPRLLSDLATDERRRATEVGERTSRGVAIVDDRGTVVWASPTFMRFPFDIRELVTRSCRANTDGEAAQSRDAQSGGDARRLVHGGDDGRQFEIAVTPIVEVGSQSTRTVALVTDVTQARRRQEQLAALDQAGRDLVRLDTEQVSRLDARERLGLLEQKISRHLSELMHFDNFTIRVLDKATNKLELVLSWGLPVDHKFADLYALPDGNGICGYVTYHGKSWVCPDVTKEPRYFAGIEGARSSLTVPLRLNDEVIGVLNVESKEPAAFNEESRQDAETIGLDIATALHILDLLVTERYTTTGKLGTDVMAEIAGPVNDILTDVENLIEDYIGHDELRHRLNKLSGTTVNLRDAIKRVTSPKRGVIGTSAAGISRTDPVLTGKRILIADDESMIRDTVRDVLVSYGCEVGVADNGDQAVEMLGQGAYDLVLSDIRMPGKNGYEVFAAAKDASDKMPVILMTGFGYDPNHSIVRARRTGLSAVLFKPFKVDQLLGEIRSALRRVAD